MEARRCERRASVAEERGRYGAPLSTKKLGLAWRTSWLLFLL